ncbi:cytochrome P450 2J3-like [Tachypleus tridentatus]|uniref:cytochrome P450 2J3-like n=1 Tax=Tachypleus tridentatus TaxID=6853 RepID=UPI003FD37072
MIEENLTGTLVNPTFATTFTSVFFVFVILHWFLRRPRNFPSGPFGLPIVGCLPFLSNKPFLDFSKLSKKYGNVFSTMQAVRILTTNGTSSIFLDMTSNFIHQWMSVVRITVRKILDLASLCRISSSLVDGKTS